MKRSIMGFIVGVATATGVLGYLLGWGFAHGYIERTSTYYDHSGKDPINEECRR